MDAFNQLRGQAWGLRKRHSRRGVVFPREWQELWQRVANSYREGQLSDNEHDTLLSLISQWSN